MTIQKVCIVFGVECSLEELLEIILKIKDVSKYKNWKEHVVNEIIKERGDIEDEEMDYYIAEHQAEEIQDLRYEEFVYKGVVFNVFEYPHDIMEGYPTFNEDGKLVFGFIVQEVYINPPRQQSTPPKIAKTEKVKKVLAELTTITPIFYNMPNDCQCCS